MTGSLFRIAVQQGHVNSVMCSYNQINGLPSCQNPATLGDLKQGDRLSGRPVPAVAPPNTTS